MSDEAIIKDGQWKFELQPHWLAFNEPPDPTVGDDDAILTIWSRDIAGKNIGWTCQGGVSADALLRALTEAGLMPSTISADASV